MQFETWTKGLADLAIDCVAVGVHDDGELSADARVLDLRCREKISRLLKRGDFSGKTGETWLLTDLEGIRAERVLLVGLGARGQDKDTLTRKAWRAAVRASINAATRTRCTALALALPRPAAEAALRRTPRPRRRRNHRSRALPRQRSQERQEAAPHALARIVVVARGQVGAGHRERLRAGFGAGHGRRRSCATSPICRAMSARPPTWARPPQDLAKSYKSLRVKVLGLPEIKKEKMGCFLAVTQGSEEPPRFLVIEHKHPKAKNAPVVLVGKGITFDTGGISLKDPPTMDEMKFDMSGAACVLGTMKAVAELNLPLNVVGLVAACENMPDGRAVKPGDIVTSAAGLTVEILNTDAEGRLVLCDALHYARRFKPEVVIDMATLTGAIVVALGVHHTGVFANDDALARELVDCGLSVDDRAWHMPLTEEYGEQLKSNFADMANVAGRDGGSCTAAAFLAKYTGGLTWAHLDIAGTAYQGGAGKGSTGRPSAMLLEYLLRRAIAR